MVEPSAEHTPAAPASSPVELASSLAASSLLAGHTEAVPRTVPVGHTAPVAYGAADTEPVACGVAGIEPDASDVAGRIEVAEAGGIELAASAASGPAGAEAGIASVTVVTEQVLRYTGDYDREQDMRVQ